MTHGIAQTYTDGLVTISFHTTQCIRTRPDITMGHTDLTITYTPILEIRSRQSLLAAMIGLSTLCCIANGN